MFEETSKFAEAFLALTGHSPMRWQERLFMRMVVGDLPPALDLPTGLGKTSVIAIWLIARALADDTVRKSLPRRLVYVVDRRAVVDQATGEAEKLRGALVGTAKHIVEMDDAQRVTAFRIVADLKARLGFAGVAKLPISTLRGQFVDNADWRNDPAACAVVVGTVDMVGSRLLFSGYGVSRKMRPFHAGLLGADTLLVLDEAHLVPPFAHLLRAIETGSSLWPQDRAPLPPFVVLPLSATQREQAGDAGERVPFGLKEQDWSDEVAATRLNARKTLRVEPLEKDHDKQLAERALALATHGGPKRVVVFCNRRDKKEKDATGPSAQGVAEAIATLVRGDKKAGRDKIDIEPPQLLVGARRVREREQVAKRLTDLGFIGKASPPAKPVILVATAAGEVGVDIDADHMVCDLVPWERMVQRLGRVNRRGNGDATVVLFDASALEKDEDIRNRLIRTRDLLQQAGSLSPGALAGFKDRIAADAIAGASTPEPLHPALTRPLADAWSMTSLDVHTGRPDITPWLRGWVEETPQTTVVWRVHLPVRQNESGRKVLLAEAEIEAFFDAAPPQVGETLETETYRVADWLEKRARAVLKAGPSTSGVDESDGDESGATPSDEGMVGEAEGARTTDPLLKDDVALVVLSPAGDYLSPAYTLGALAAERKGREPEDFQRRLARNIVVVDARLAGLGEDGLLDDAAAVPPLTADADPAWSQEAGFRVQLRAARRYEPKDGWRFEAEFDVAADADDDATQRLIVEHFKGEPQSHDGRSTAARPQELAEHQVLAEHKAKGFASTLGLPEVAVRALGIAARLHDEGKRARNWQLAFKAQRDAARWNLAMPLAKTRGPINQALLGGYRHEFGSLPALEKDDEFLALPVDWQDLVRHIVAAHHGSARPVISTLGCEGAASELTGRARGVALRFARLQERWGPWGLAWWESLLRAADQQASRDNDERSAPVELLRERADG